MVDLQIEGGRRVRAKVISGKITFLDDKNKEISSRKKLKVPEGAIKSLRPLLQEAFGLFGEDQGQGYWEKLSQEAPLKPYEACNKLRNAGINHIEATRLIIDNEPRVQEALSHGDICDDTIESFVSLVSATILQEYNRNKK